MTDPVRITDWQQEFDLDPTLAYLNHAAVSPWPLRTVSAVQRFAAENGRTGAWHYEHWLRAETYLRTQCKTLLNAASTAEIGFQKNTSEGLSTLAWGYPWTPGDNVVIPEAEFPSNRIVWESLSRSGVAVRAVDLPHEAPEQRLMEACDEHTRIISVSAVQYGNGLKLDLGTLGAFCRRSGIIFCVDAIQQLGAAPLDVEAVGADVVVADAHKWLMGPEGIAIFYVRQGLQDRLALHEFGWHMVEHAGDYSRTDWRPARTARRFECGSPNMLGEVALSASLELLMGVGIETVASAIDAHTARLTADLSAMAGVEVLSPLTPDRRGGIVTFRHRSVRTPEVFAKLKDAGVACAMRGGGIRLSPHFYTPDTALARTLQLVDRM